MAKKKVRARKAMLRGTLFVYWPFIVMAIAANFYFQSEVDPTETYLYGMGFFVLAWAWWSFSVPRWRMWLIKNVDDVLLAYKTSVKNGLMWRPGHIVESTEFKSNQQGIDARRIEFDIFMGEFIEESQVMINVHGLQSGKFITELNALTKDFKGGKNSHSLMARKENITQEVKENFKFLFRSWKWVRWILDDYVKRVER